MRELPHFFSIISRIVFVFAIVGALVLVFLGTSKAPLESSQIQPTVSDNISNRLGEVEQLLAVGNAEQAKKELREILVFWPTNTYALNLLAKTKGNDNQIWEEIARVQVIVEARPDYKAAWENLAILYLQVGEDDLAQQAQEKAQGLKAS